ncbi:MAG: glycosyltransferase family 4 protein [Thermoguttaceae bacterium]|jgi:glycosyltransferase involved in cell wall biosynthesis
MIEPNLLLISQVYVPDPASVGQHLHDMAGEMARRGYGVRVYAASHGYDWPENHYPRRESRDGVDVMRLPLSSFGKKTTAIRLLGQISFLAQTMLRGLLMRRPGAILVSTSPPMCAAAGWLLSLYHRAPLIYWVMDINPDQAVAAGLARPRSLSVRIFDWFNRAALGRAHTVVALDRFMAARLIAKREIGDKLEVFPPWPHEDHLEDIPHAQNPFRKEHGLEGKFVVMYSGNHSPVNPISTVLQAAAALRQSENIVFVFVGGGAAKKEVEATIAAGATNLVSLPYQPIEQLKYSLSAADLHVVTLGSSGVGIVHPCKIYGAMLVGRPILAVSPRPSHISDLLDQCDFGRRVEQGDVQGAIRAITELAACPAAVRAAMGRRGKSLVERALGKSLLCNRFAGIIEAAWDSRRPLHVFRPGHEYEMEPSGEMAAPDRRRKEAA